MCLLGGRDSAVKARLTARATIDRSGGGGQALEGTRMHSNAVLGGHELTLIFNVTFLVIDYIILMYKIDKYTIVWYSI